MKRVLAVLLAFILTATMLPEEMIGRWSAAAEENAAVQAQAQTAKAALADTEASFAELAETARQTGREAEDDGEWQYIVLEKYNYAIVTGHRDQGKDRVDIPAALGGADVVALLSGVFEGHNALCSVTMAGNIYYAASDALPRGVTVRGYNGSYAESWAAENRRAFENMSQLDFVAGVVDCSDIDAVYFTRHSENSITMRALEANRLTEGSVFFLADPRNLYAVSYYQAVSMEEKDGFVTVTCATPEVNRVVHSFSFENETMMADWSTVELADGVTIDEEAQRRRASGEVSTELGMTFTPSIKISKNVKFVGTLGYKGAYTVSASYANLEMETYKVEATETYTAAGKFEVSNSALNDHYDAQDNISDNIKKLIRGAREVGKPIAEKLDIHQPLCNVVLVSLWGFVSVGAEISFDVTFKGSIEVKYTMTTTTEYNYTGGELKSTSRKNEKGVSVTATAEVKVGVSVGLKLYVFVVEIASIEVFFGIKAEAKIVWDFTVDLDENTLLEQLEQNLGSPAYLNMLDCVQLDISIVCEISCKLGNKYVTAFEKTWTVFDVPILKMHYHWNDIKWVSNGEEYQEILFGLHPEPKTLKDMLHLADECPLMDAVSLMVPSINKKDAMGTVTLMGKETLDEEPELELPDYGVRVRNWYHNELLTELVEFPVKVESGDKLYGDAEEVAFTKLIDYRGKTLKNKAGGEVNKSLMENETVNTRELDLKKHDNIVGWVYVQSAEDLTFVGEVMWQQDIDMAGDGEDHTLLAICNDDLTVIFKDLDGKELKRIKTGHFIDIEEKDAPKLEQPYDPDYAVAVYEWRDLNGKLYEFPAAADGTVGEELVLCAALSEIDRMYQPDDSATMLTGGGSGSASGLTVYGSERYFRYSVSSDGVIITGFQPEQKYTDENGEEKTWMAIPEALTIPAYIDGLPVRSVSDSAFKDLGDLVYIKLPSTITAIGASAFAHCTALRTIDLSECSALTEIPGRMAYGNAMLDYVVIPASVERIGSEAFSGCTALTSAVINADIGSSAFAGCKALRSVDLRYGVTSIGGDAFRGCESLAGLFVPCSVEMVGDSFIYGCTGLKTLVFDGGPTDITAGMLNIGENSALTTLEIGLGVLTIGKGAFSNGWHGNPNLVSLTLPEALREVGEDALKGTAIEYLKIADLGLLGEGFARDCDSLKEVVFERGVISAYAFYGCDSLERVKMGENVFAVGDHAFEGCGSLKEIVIGSGVETIGVSAFEDCAGLERVVMGDKLKEIGSNAFADCFSLNEVVFGKGLKKVGGGAFYNCLALEELYLPDTVEEYGFGIVSNCTNLKRLSIGGPNTPVLDGLSWLGNIANSALETLIINPGVTSIGDGAFRNYNWSGTSGYQKLTSITLPDTLESIGAEAFYGASALKEVKLPASVKNIGDSAFWDCSSMNLVCEEGIELESIGANAFVRCKSMTQIDLGESLVSVGSGAFSGCSSLSQIVFPESVNSFGENVVDGCTGLKVLSIGGPDTPVLDGAEWLGTINNSALETLIINEGVIEIADGAFRNYVWGGVSCHTKLKRIVLPSTLEKIGEYAFYSMGSLEEVTLPAGLKEIGAYAFDYCASMDLICEEGLELESIGAFAFAGCKSLTGIELGESLVSVGNSAFNGCAALEQLVFPESITSFGEDIISGCSGLKLLSLGGPNTPVLDGAKWLGEINNSTLETLIINEGVTELAGNAFRNYVWGGVSCHTKLKNVSLPSTLEKIGEYAFYSMGSLGKVTLPAGVKQIGAYAFEYCASMDLICEEGLELESIGAFAFAGCKSLTGIELGESLVSVGNSAFNGCAALKQLRFPESITSFGEDIISGCSGLKLLSLGGPNTPVLDGAKWLGEINNSTLETLIINEGVTELAGNAFRNYVWGGVSCHTKLKNVSLPSTLEKIGEYAFYSMGSLEEVTLPAGLKEIGAYAFEYCASMDLICEEGLELESIGAFAFAGCKSLTGIELGESLVSVGNSAFNGCAALKQLRFPESITSFGEDIISGCSGLKLLSLGGPNTPVLDGAKWLGEINNSTLETLIINEGVTELADGAFRNYIRSGVSCHTKLKNVSLPSTLEKIGQHAFYSAGSLETVTLPAGVKQIGAYAFEYCASMDLICEEGLELESIGAFAFAGCKSLTGISLEQSLVSIGEHAFYQCASLEELHIPASVESFGNNIIRGCTGLKVLSIGGPNTPVLDGAKWLGAINNSVLETLIINEGVTEIADRAFYNDATPDHHTKLISISLPSTLQKIGADAFSGAVVRVNLSDSIVSIGDTAFTRCGNLTELHSGSYNEEIARVASLKGMKYTYDSAATAQLVLMNGDETLYEGEMEAGASLSEVLAAYAPAPAEGAAFAGWSLTPGGEHWNGNTMPGAVLKLHADMRSRHKAVFIGLCEGEEVFRKELTLFEGEKVGWPNTPSEEGYRFEGWYADEAMTQAFDSGSVMGGQELVVYGRLTADEGKKAEGFMLTLMHEGKAVFSENVQQGSSIVKMLAAAAPNDADGMTFDVWCTDEALSAEWRLNDMPGFALTLYAKMIPVHTVSFIALCGGQELYRCEIEAGEGRLIPWPEEPEATGYRFEGWYADAQMSTLLSEKARMGQSDMTVYGRMSSMKTGAVYAKVNGGVELVRYMPAKGETEIWLPAVHQGQPVVSIAESAFDDAEGIRTIHLPDALMHVDAQAFSHLEQLEWIAVSPNCAGYTSVNGVLYTKDMRTLVCFPRSKPAVSLNVPEGVVEIAAHACENAVWLQRVKLADSVRVLGDYAFAGCKALRTFTAYGLEQIGTEAICTDGGMLEVFGPVKTGVLRDYMALGANGGYTMFKGSYNIYAVSLYLDGELKTVIGLEAGSTLPAEVICGELSDGKLIHTWYTDEAMSRPWNMGDVTSCEDFSLYALSEKLYEYEEAEFSVNGEARTGILLTAYNGLGGAVVLPDELDGLTVMGIGEAFLSGCHGAVSSVQIGSSVISIADSALAAPEGWPFGGRVKADDGSYAAAWAKERGYTVETGTYTLRFVTNGGSGIAEREVGKSVAVKLPVPVKTGCSFAGWYADADLLDPVRLEDGCFVMPGRSVTLYAAWDGTEQEWDFEFEEKNGKIAIVEYTGSAEELIVPAEINGMTVAEIAGHAFSGNETLISVTLPDSVKSIGSFAFSGAAIKHIDMGGAQTVGAYAFAYCDALERVRMENVKELKNNAFAGCGALSAVHLSAALTAIGDEAFDGCTALEEFSVETGNPLFSAKDGALILSGSMLYCYPAGRANTEYVMPDGVSMIMDGAFKGAARLQKIVLSDGMKYIGSGAFEDCTALTSFEMTDLMTVREIPADAFAGCAALEIVVIGEGVEAIGDRAFMGCTALKRVGIPASVTEISAAAFDQSGRKLTVCGTYGSAAWRCAGENGFLFEDPDVIAVEDMAIANEKALTLGDAVTLSATLTPADAALCGEIKWSSDNADVICVYGNEAHAVGLGTAVITATAPNGVTVSAEFTVVNGVRSVVLSMKQAKLSVGESIALTAQAEPADAENAQISWTASNEAIATVDANGVVTARGNGVAVIRAASANGRYAECWVYVLQELPLSAKSVVMTAGQQAQIELIGIPQAALADIRWESSDETVAKVRGGVIEALNAGEAEIRCIAAEGLEAAIRITVAESLNTLTLPGMLQSIEEEAFAAANGVQRIAVGEKAKAIGRRAFAEIESLVQIELPESLEDIAPDAFERSESVVILCKAESCAHEFAREAGIAYVVMEADQ